MSNSIYEVNGKAYDSRSGALPGNTARTQPAMTVYPRPASPTRQAGGSVDGMVSPAQRHTGQAKTAPHHVKAHQTQPTKTLMRQAVARPHPSSLHGGAHKAAPASLHPQAPIQPHTPVSVNVAPKLSSTVIDPVRAQRARFAGRSNNVAHFRPAPQPSQAQAQQLASQPAPQPVQPAAVAAPVQVRTQPHPVQPAHHPVAAHPTQPQPQQPQQQSMRPIAAARRPYAQPAAPAAASRREQDEEQDLFAQALAQAKSHEEPEQRESAKKAVRRKGSKARRFAIASASLAVFVALSGFVAFQNRSQIQLQMASAKAGFAASTPLFMPPGYKLDSMTYATGSVATSYNSSGKAPFSITQKKSNWNSQTLLDNFVATSGDDYKGFQSNGRTVYIYGKGNATWVNGGIWYQIKGADKLSDEQLVKIATSM